MKITFRFGGSISRRTSISASNLGCLKSWMSLLTSSHTHTHTQLKLELFDNYSVTQFAVPCSSPDSLRWSQYSVKRSTHFNIRAGSNEGWRCGETEVSGMSRCAIVSSMWFWAELCCTTYVDTHTHTQPALSIVEMCVKRYFINT